MLISQEQHEDYQLGVTKQVATRLGIMDPSIYPENELLEKMTGNPNVYLALTQFKNTYRDWYKKSVELEKAAEAGRAEATAIREQVRELRLRRDHQRKLLVAYLDAHYPLHTSTLSHGG